MPDFPDFAVTGIGLADMTIIKDWQRTCDRHALSRVKIWSLDADLRGYDRQAAGIG